MKRKTKVMWLIKGLGVGGAEKLLEMAIPHIDRDRFDYEISYLLPWKNALTPAFDQAGIPVFCLDQRRFYDVRVFPRLVRLLRQRQVDLLHVHLPYTGIIGRIAAKMAPVQGVVYTEHNLWERYHPLTAAANRMTFGWNDYSIAVSDEVEKSIRARYKSDQGLRLDTIVNGVNEQHLATVSRDPQGVKEEFGIPAENRLVVHVGNFTPKKRHEDLLKAASQILKQDPRVSFLLVGHGPLEEQIKGQANELRIQSNVVFSGFRPDATRLIASADLFVLSSQYEGLPISVLEAMALGTPVVATNVGGIPEAITSGTDGLLVDPLDPEKLASSVLAILADTSLRQRFSGNGVKRIREAFSMQTMVEKTEAVYGRVLAGKGCPDSSADPQQIYV